MNLISAKCPNCGANIKVDGESKIGRCEFCGAEYITQDVINQYSVNNHYSTVQYVTKNIAGGTGLEAEEYIRKSEKGIFAGDRTQPGRLARVVRHGKSLYKKFYRL